MEETVIDPKDEEVVAMRTRMFSVEELMDMHGLKSGGGGSAGDVYVEVTCGCTSRRYGDAGGRLRISASGLLEIICQCIPGCKEGKLTPAAFEKHSGKESWGWKNNIWVMIDGDRVPLYRTALLKYYDQASKRGSGSRRSYNAKVFHRDEFVRCTLCNKDRRFRLRNKKECRIYHDALAEINWKCSDMPDDEIACDDDEERASRRAYRGCSQSPTCKGCTSCVCFGCEMCRFSDCGCQTCSGFTWNTRA